MLLGYFLFEFLIFNPFPQLVALCFGFSDLYFAALEAQRVELLQCFHAKCVKYVSLVMHGKIIVIKCR